MTGTTLIKKYGNRRLYDTRASAYITLEELEALVRRGADVRVVDANTNGDLTQQTLAQVILESRHGADLLPVPLLVQLIRMGDDALAEFFGRYVTGALELYLQGKQGGAIGFNPFGGMPFASNPFARMFSGAGAWGAPSESREKSARRKEPNPSPTREPQADRTAEDVADLRRELDALKAALRRKK